MGNKKSKSKSPAPFDSLELLKEIPLLRTLKANTLQKLYDCLKKQDFKAGAKLMKFGEEGSEFFIILSGKCEVLDSAGKSVATLKAGDYCGEQSLLRQCTRNATVRAVGKVGTLSCDKKTFDSVLAENVAFVKREAKRKAVLTNIKLDRQASEYGDTTKDDATKEWLVNQVADNVMFMHLSEAQRSLVIDQMYQEDISKGFELITQGDTDAQTFYVVASGAFDVFVHDKNVATIPAGGCFGELALMYKAPRAATVQAKEDSVVWTVRRNAFRTALARHNKQRNEEQIGFLRGLEFLNALLEAEVSLLAEALEKKNYKPGAIIINQGEDADKFYIIKKGNCEWQKTVGGGDDESGVLDAGKYFGELALMNNDKRAATVRAGKQGVQCLELSRANFEEILGPLNDMMSRKAEVAYAPQSPVAGKVLGDVCSLQELKTIGVLGKGAFGLVTLVVDPNTKNSFALKAIKKSQIVELGQESHIINEKNVMQMMSNDFLVNLCATYKDQYRVYFLLDVCLGGELFTILRRRRYFNEKTAKFYAGCVVEAFDYMHGKSILYRDLKPENLVLDTTGYLKVTDFGFAKKVKDKTFTLCGTPDYLAPEIVTGQGHGKGVDWWTLGILIYEMLASFPPFFDDEPIETYRKIIKCRLKFPRYFSPESKELIKGLLRPKATRRLGVIHGGADTIRRHNWYKNWKWDELTGKQMKPPIVPTVKSNDDISNFEQTKMEKESLTAVAPDKDKAFDDF